jgi:hypothetical protein
MFSLLLTSTGNRASIKSGAVQVTKVVVVAGVDANPRYKGTKDLFIESWPTRR